jgi:hypothetical protein
MTCGLKKYICGYQILCSAVRNPALSKSKASDSGILIWGMGEATFIYFNYTIR